MLFGAYKYLIGEYHMIKTILTFTQTIPFPRPQMDNIMDQCAAWQNEGKYTGEIDVIDNPVTGTKCVNRWAWIDNDTAEAYKNLVLSSWIDLYPDINVDIVVE